MTAAGVGAAAIIGVIGFAATRTVPSDIDHAASATTVLAPATTTTDAPVAAAGDQADTSSLPSAPTAAAAATTVAPTTSPPPSTAPPLHPATPPAYPAAGEAVWPYGPFWRVPQLGAEGQVRGTGCGSAGNIADVIPDGLFAVFVTGHDANNVSLDLLCIFDIPTASALPSAGAVVVSDAPNYVIVNNSSRVAHDADGRVDRAARRRARRRWRLCRRGDHHAVGRHPTRSPGLGADPPGPGDVGLRRLPTGVTRAARPPGATDRTPR